MNTLTKGVIDWMKELADRYNFRKAILGISGGKDSTVVAGLCKEVFGAENTYGILMPNGDQKDISDSWKVVDYLGIKHDVVNIGDAFREIGAAIPGFFDSDAARTNLPARLRMSTVYAYGQTVNAVVMNTCNLSEDTVGYATLYGDSAGSMAPLSRLTTEEVMEIGDDLGLPTELVHKTPIDGLQPLSDEDKLGFTYHEVNELIRKGIKGPNYEKIMDMYRKNKFKTEIIQIPHFEPYRANYITGEYIE